MSAFLKLQGGEIAQIANQEAKFRAEFTHVFPNRDKEDYKRIINIIKTYPDFVFYSVKLLVLAIKIAEENGIRWWNYDPKLTDDFTPYIARSLPWLYDPNLEKNIDPIEYKLFDGSYTSFVIDLDRMLKNLTKPIKL
jgi:hypothetical protein